MSDQGQGGQYPPGGRSPSDPAWGTPPAQPDPWRDPSSPYQGGPGYGVPPSEPDYSTPNAGYPPQQGSPYGSPTSGPGYAAPGSGAGYSAPGSGAGYSTPGSGAGYASPGSGAGYAAPASGRGYGAPPTSGFPGNATQPMPALSPASAPAASAPTNRRGPTMPLLAAATALLLVLAIVMSGLFFWKIGQQSDTATKLTASEQRYDRDVAARDARISSLQSDLNAAKTELESTKQQLEGTKNRLGTANADKQVIAQCLSLVLKFIDAVAKRDTATATSLLTQLRDPCNQANTLI